MEKTIAANGFESLREEINFAGIQRVIANNGIHCGSITVVQDDNTIKVWGNTYSRYRAKSTNHRE